MNILSPSILSGDFTCLGEQLATLDRAGAEYVHIDVMDGVFVPSISYGMPVIKSIRKATDRVFDVHLMIVDPLRYIREFAEVGSDIITFHYEATKDPDAVIAEIHRCGKKAGIAIKPTTMIKAVEPYIDVVDQILVMTVVPGFGGQKYIPASTQRIADVRRMVNEHNAETNIQVDGGIYVENVDVVLDAGANVIVSGSGVFKGDIEENIKKFKEKMNQ